MRLYITTLGRLHAQTTLATLPKEWLQHTTMVVQDHEYAAHRERWENDVEVRALEPHIRTLGPTRAAVFGWRESKKIVMLDDDLSFYARKASGDWHLRNATSQDVSAMLEQVCRELDNYAHVGVGGREGHNRVEADSVECSRYMRLLAYRTDIVSAEHGRIDGMSDFDVNLQLLRAGRPSRVLYGWGQRQRGTQAPGGCSLNRTHETHNAEIDKMIAWHSPFVAPRDKVNKTGGELGRRRELTIYWKRAFDSAGGRRAVP